MRWLTAGSSTLGSGRIPVACLKQQRSPPHDHASTLTTFTYPTEVGITDSGDLGDGSESGLTPEIWPPD
ncbi:hypothetical protein NL676_020492 [Syzygium grande]|nr:hypothetical protein NL676_020492 [Syzygium grande]